MREGVAELAESLSEYPVRLALHNFASSAPATGAPGNQPLPLTALDEAGIQTVADWVNGIQRPASQQGGTNWDRAFAAAAGASEHDDGLLFVTDGNPTQYGSPAQGPGSSTDLATIDAAVESANAFKAQGSRVIGVGLTDNIAHMGEFRQHMAQISRPVEGSDYLETDFENLSELVLQFVEADCAIDLVKTGSIIDDDTIRYEFTATNNGGRTLTDVAIDDPKPGLSDLEYSWPGEPGVLQPGESVTATATYVLTQADVNAGQVDNHATTTGTPPSGDPVEDEDDVTVPVDPAAAIDLVKTGGSVTAGIALLALVLLVAGAERSCSSLAVAA